MENKYNLTQEQNIFLAKRNIIDSIWKSANLEGIGVTFQETQAIYEGENVAHLRIDEILTINNLKHAWQFLISSINEEISFNYISSINSLVGNNIIESPGKLRVYNVKMGGTEWVPEIPSIDRLNELLEEIKQIKNETERCIVLMCKLMKMQLFNDGNKRTSMLIANHELIKNGKGIIAIPHNKKVEFGSKLISFYENEEKLKELVEFLFEECLYGIE